MQIDYIPLLQIARDLHDIPRGMERFTEYLRTITNEAHDDIDLVPLVAMNPMGREHVAARLDELIAMNTEEIVAEAVREAEARLTHVEGQFKHGLVVCDDVRGGWTNRYTSDAAGRIPVKLDLKRRWISTVWWVSEAPSREALRAEVLESIARVAYVLQHGAPKTLRQIMKQEGYAALFAGKTPHLDEEDIAYSRYVLESHLDTDNYTVIMAAIYGDEAARMLGYEPLGLSNRAGLAVALADVRV